MAYFLAEVLTLFKEADPFDKIKYRSFNLLSHMSQIFERINFNQMNEYFERFLSNLLTGYCKNYNTPH